VPITEEEWELQWNLKKNREFSEAAKRNQAKLQRLQQR